MSLRQKAIVGLAVVAAWVAVASVATHFWTRISEPAAPVERHFAALKRGDVEAAYADMAAAYRAQTAFADFRDAMTSRPALSRIADFNFPNRKIGPKAATLVGSLTDDAGGRYVARYDLVKEEGAWRIRAFQVRPESMPQ
jgi:hypothetical protein